MSKNLEELKTVFSAEMADFDRPLLQSEKLVGKFTKTMEAEGKKMDAQWKLYAATTKNSATSVTFLAEKHNYLSGKLSLADERVLALSKQFDIMAAKPGTTAASLAKMSVKVDEAKVAQARLRDELEKIDTPLKRYSIALGAAGDNLTKIGGTLTRNITAPILAGGAALGLMVSQAAKYGDELLTMSNQTGLSVERLQELRYVASQMNSDFTALTQASVQLSRTLVEGGEEGTRAGEVLAMLGIQAKNADGSYRSMNDVLPDVIDRLASVSDQTLRTEMATRLFGRGATDLLPLLSAGSGEIANLTKEARDMGYVLSGQTVQDLGRFNDKMEALKLRFSVVGAEIGEKFLPILEEDFLPLMENTVIPAIEKTTDKVGDLVKEFNDLDPASKKSLEVVAGGILLLGPGVTIIGSLAANFATLVGWIKAAGLALKANPELLAIAVAVVSGWQAGKSLAEIIGDNQKKAQKEDTANRLGIHGQEEVGLFAGKMAGLKGSTTTPSTTTPGTGGGGTGGSGTGGTGVNPFDLTGSNRTWLDDVQDKLDALSTRIDVAQSKYDLFQAKITPSTTETEKLNAQMDMEHEKMALVQERIDTLTGAYDRMAESKGELADETQRLYNQLLKEKIALEELERKQEGASKMDPMQAKTIALIQSRQAELLNSNVIGALELQRIFTPDEAGAALNGLQSGESGANIGAAEVAVSNTQELAEAIGDSVSRKLRPALQTTTSKASTTSLASQRAAYGVT